MANEQTIIHHALSNKLNELYSGLVKLNWWRRKDTFDGGLALAYINLKNVFYFTRNIVTVLSGRKEPIQPDTKAVEYVYGLYPFDETVPGRNILLTTTIAAAANSKIDVLSNVTEFEGIRAVRIWASIMLLRIQAIKPAPDDELLKTALHNIETSLTLCIEYLFDEMMERAPKEKV